MSYASNCPVSGPRHVKWTPTWNIGGLAWSYSDGFFYDVASPDDGVALIKPKIPAKGNR